MKMDQSFYGPCLQRSEVPTRRGREHPRILRITPLLVMVLVAVIVLSMSIVVVIREDSDLTARISSQTLLSVPFIEQRKDTTMRCNGGPFCQSVPGVWPAHPMPPFPPPTDIPSVDTMYGTIDDCPHCSAYCAPASIAMIASFRGFFPPMTDQDWIYDFGKIVGETAQGDLVIDTHAVGMFDGTGAWPVEVQISFIASIGPMIQHDWPSGTQLTAAQLKSYIVLGHPVMWLDHGGWPKNCSYPQDPYRSAQGHAKVIAGYDDSETADFGDDIVLVCDPWPEYNHRSILPKNATNGPGGTFSPYWLPLNDVNLSDQTDIFLVDTFPDIPEFSTVIVPLIGVLMAVTAARIRRRRAAESVRGIPEEKT